MADPRVWIVSAGMSRWVVRATSEEHAIDVAYNGPTDDDITAREMGADPLRMMAYEVADGPPAIVQYMGS